MDTPTTQTIQTDDEATEARNALARRLEAFARRVRASTTTDIEALDAAYSDVVKLAGQWYPVLG